MKLFRWGLGLMIAVVTLTLLAPNVTHAAAHRKPTPHKKTEPKPPAHWEVMTADASANTLEIMKSDGSTNLTFKITSTTKIKLDGKKAALGDLQKGQKLTYSAAGDTCSSIEATTGGGEKTTKKK